ncbi:MAG TPA: energy transducer TonB [Terracidiphilus sp.]|jgi:TonB family protein
MSPWHLKASYTLFDENGASPVQGTFEEWWDGEQSRKTAYSSPSFVQTDYVNGEGTFRTGMQASSPFFLAMLGRQLTEPLSVHEEKNEQMIVESEVREQGDAKSICLKQTGVRTSEGERKFGGSLYSYCVNPDGLVLTSVESGPPNAIQLVRTRFIAFHQRNIPADVVALRNGKRVFEARVDSLDGLDRSAKSSLTPPPDAKLVGFRVTLSAAVAQRMVVQKKAPDYPADAKAAGVSGTVSIEVLISKDGRVSDAYVSSGPPELQQAALDAVRKWVYSPYLLRGVPVEASTTVYVIFSLSS